MKDTRLTYEAPELKVFEMHLEGCIASSMNGEQIERFGVEENFNELGN